jgi:TctA family transporter
MDLIDGLFQALQSMQSWMFLLAFLIGCANGMFFALLPGLSGSVGIALMIPFTFGLGVTEAMALFVSALAGQNFAGSITAILINTPGSSPSAATTFDGYPLARQGRGGFAIGVSAAASFLGSLIGIVVILALFPVMRSVILSFSFPEFTMLGVVGLAVIAVASRGSVIKGLISGLIGLLVSFVGFSPIGGDLRYVFDQPMLMDGISVTAVLIGLFAITEAIRLLVDHQQIAKGDMRFDFGRSQVWEGVRYVLNQPFLLLRSSLLGTGIGLVPAVGGTLASFLAYFQAAKTVRNSRFGLGDPRGVLAPEAANDAKDAGSALPSLAFGIPGSADWAIVLGAMLIHGITPGPNLIRDSPDIIWTAILVIIASSFLTSVVGVCLAPYLTGITKLRPGLLAPVVVVLAVTGALAMEGRVMDVVVVIGFGLFGFAMRSVGMPVIPLILGLVLGPMVERSFLQTLSTFGGLDAFVTRPISLLLVVLTVAVLAFEVISGRRQGAPDPGLREAGIRSAVRPVSIIMMAALAALAAAAIALATGFGEDGRLFPTITASLLLALTAAYLLIAGVPWLRTRLGGVIVDGGGMEQMINDTGAAARRLASVPAEPGIHAPAARPTDQDGVTQGSGPTDLGQGVAVTDPDRHAGSDVDSGVDEAAAGPLLRDSILLLVAFGLGTLLIGLAPTVPVVLALLVRVVGREGWRVTAALTVVTCAVLYALFVVLLNVPLEGGLLLSY